MIWHVLFSENPQIIFVLFYDVHKENMFIINLEDGREAPIKASTVQSGTGKVDPARKIKCTTDARVSQRCKVYRCELGISAIHKGTL